MQLEHLLTDEQKAIRGLIRKFVEKEIMPIRREMEEDYSLVEGVLQKLLDLGIGRLGDPDESDTLKRASATTETIIYEELSKGDAGVSLCVGGVTGGLVKVAALAGNKVVAERFGPAFSGNKLNYACLSMTDAAGGADTENPVLQGRGISTRAQLDGDEWVINGTKSWPTHAGIACVYMTICTTDPQLGEDGIALIFVPSDTEGLSFGKPESKMGYRTSINASIFYDNVRVPKAYRLAGPGRDAQFFAAIAGTGAQKHSATMSVGTAEAAFDIALDYTKERKSGGKPVRAWSLAAGMLADMAIQTEMARGALYNLSSMLDHQEIYGPPFSPQMVSKASATKVFAADTAVWVANKAAELMGSNGISPEYHLEKYLRDAKITQLWLGGQQISRYRVAQGYYDYVI